MGPTHPMVAASALWGSEPRNQRVAGVACWEAFGAAAETHPTTTRHVHGNAAVIRDRKQERIDVRREAFISRSWDLIDLHLAPNTGKRDRSRERESVKDQPAEGSSAHERAQQLSFSFSQLNNTGCGGSALWYDKEQRDSRQRSLSVIYHRCGAIKMRSSSRQSSMSTCQQG